jgi:triosephosphate isomerase (TIM)
MSRQKFVAGNWKMFTSAVVGRELAATVAAGVSDDRVKVAVCPPFPYLTAIAVALKGTRVALGAQNVYPAKEGAFTGEVSPEMLRDVGCRYVIVGHSERRHGLCEQDDFINRKVRAAMDGGLDVILCVGETLEERDANKTDGVLRRQLTAGFHGVEPTVIDRLVVAYEPVWAIGTGKTATPAQAQEAHAFIRELIGGIMGPQAGSRLVIQYGGSVKPDNAAEIMRQPDVDGALVGGASLNADSFLAIVQAAR